VVGFVVSGSIDIDGDGDADDGFAAFRSTDDAAGVGTTVDAPCKMLRSAPRSVVKVLAETEEGAEATRSSADCVDTLEARLVTEDKGNFKADTGESPATGLPEVPEDAAAGVPEAKDATEDEAAAPDGTPLEAAVAFPPPFTPTAVHPGT
jgi:hypothetical protein